jgi:N-acetylmuramoyl-L-alanine amidase
MHINTKFFSPNCLSRVTEIEYIILHYTGISFQDALAKLTDIQSEVSTHYLIKEDGEIFQLVDDDKIAWHAGKSHWQGRDELNQNSLGIEMDNCGILEFSSNQMQSCIELCRYLVDKYHINPANIIGHSDVAPHRKIDPGIFFDWQTLANNGLGHWHNLEYSPDLAKTILYKIGHKGLGIKKLQQNLKMLGYKTNISGQLDIQTNNVIRAFQSHFCTELIRQKGGIDFYQDLTSTYNWDSFSNQVLYKMLSLKKQP